MAIGSNCLAFARFGPASIPQTAATPPQRPQVQVPLLARELWQCLPTPLLFGFDSLSAATRTGLNHGFMRLLAGMMLAFQPACGTQANDPPPPEMPISQFRPRVRWAVRRVYVREPPSPVPQPGIPTPGYANLRARVRSRLLVFVRRPAARNCLAPPAT